MRLIISICIFTTVVCFHGTLNRIGHIKSYNPVKSLNIKNHKNSKNRVSNLSMGVEHLINCATNGISNGFLNSDMCLDHDMNHVFQMLATDIFERIVTIGMLVAFYFYFKRLAITQPVTNSNNNNRNRRTNRSMNSNYNDSNNNNFDFTNNNDDNYDNNDDVDEAFDNYQECPKCNGTGRNLFNKSMLCDLCSGTGEVDLPTVPKRYNLPTSRPPSSPYDNQ